MPLPKRSKKLIVRMLIKVPSNKHVYCSIISDIDNNCVSEPCQNGGTCGDLVNGYQCTCSENFTGIVCEAGKLALHIAAIFLSQLRNFS